MHLWVSTSSLSAGFRQCHRPVWIGDVDVAALSVCRACGEPYPPNRAPRAERLSCRAAPCTADIERAFPRNAWYRPMVWSTFEWIRVGD